MSNQLNMAEHHAIIGLARLNWSYRRIAAELGVDRESRIDSNPQSPDVTVFTS